MAEFEQKCIHVRVVGIGDVQGLAGVRRVARDEHETKLSSTRVVHEEPAPLARPTAVRPHAHGQPGAAAAPRAAAHPVHAVFKPLAPLGLSGLNDESLLDLDGTWGWPPPV